MHTRIGSWIRGHKLELGIFFVAFLIRLFLIALYLMHGNGSFNFGADGGDYVNEAKNLLAGHGFSREWAPPYLPDAIRTPLYPLFLATSFALFGSFTSVLFIEAFLGSLLPILFLRMARLFVQNRYVLLLGALFIAVEPHLLFNTTFFASEGISIILLTWGLFELLRMVYGKREKLRAETAGLFLGVTTLVRPITFYLPIFLLPLFAYQAHLTHEWRKTLKLFWIFCVFFVLAISPWLVRNYAVFGSASMATVGWFNVYTRLAATVVAIDSGDDFYTSYQKLLDELSVRGYIAHAPPVSEYEIEDPRFGPILKKESLRIISEHPRAFIIYLFSTPFSVLTQDNTLGYVSYFVPLTINRPPFSPTLYASQHGFFPMLGAVAPYLTGIYIIPYLMRAFFLVLFMFALLGTYLLFKWKKRFAGILLFGFIGYITLFSINAGGQIDGRYRAQFLIPETVLAVVALERILSMRLRSRSTIPA